MKTIIKSIRMENFKGARNPKEIPFGENAEIRGRNASGKTTVLDALWWLLFNKDSLGNEKFSIRPLDSDGKQIDNVDISVSAVLDINGEEMELKKVQKQNWVKKRGTGETQLQGNVNSYEIDGYPKSEKEYKSRISEIAEEDLFKILTNPAHFPSMKWQEQRAVLMRFVSEISDVELAKKDSRFTELLDELRKAPSTDDIKKKYQKALTEWKKKQEELPVRIDEVAKQKTDIDVAELELQRNALNEQIAKVKEKAASVEKQVEEYQKLSDGIMELKFVESDLQRKANEGLLHQRKDLQSKIDEKNDYLTNISEGIQHNNREIEGYEINIESGTKERNRLAELWKSVNSEVFDESATVCPACRRELPQDEIEALLSSFEKSKAERLAKIEKDGLLVKRDIENAKETITKLQECNKDNLANKEKLEQEVSDLEKQLSELPQSIDISDTEEYKSIQSQIAEKENAMREMNSADEIRKSIRRESESLLLQLYYVDKKIAKSQKNVEIDERIADLQKEQREVAQKVADQEKMLFLLEEFIRYKMDTVSDTINSKFELVNFILFKNLINGGLQETCECEYLGVPYSSLNSAAKIQCGLDIIRSLQRLCEVYLPVFIDNRESCTEIPKMDCQVINMYVDPRYEELVVEFEG